MKQKNYSRVKVFALAVGIGALCVACSDSNRLLAPSDLDDSIGSKTITETTASGIPETGAPSQEQVKGTSLIHTITTASGAESSRVD